MELHYSTRRYNRLTIMACVNASGAHNLEKKKIGKFAEKYIIDVQRKPA